MKTDYSEEIKMILKSNYNPVVSSKNAMDYTERKTLSDVYKEITSVLPKLWVEETDVYNALQELGFQAFFYTADEDIDEESGEISKNKKKAGYFMNPII